MHVYINHNNIGVQLMISWYVGHHRTSYFVITSYDVITKVRGPNVSFQEWGDVIDMHDNDISPFLEAHIIRHEGILNVHNIN